MKPGNNANIRNGMSAFDYFFENTSHLDKLFLEGKEEISFKELYQSALHLSIWLRNKVGENKHIIILSENNLYFIRIYLAVLKSGNICIPLDPAIEKENFRYIRELVEPSLIFTTGRIKKRLEPDFKEILLPEMLPSDIPGTPEEPKNDFIPDQCAEIIFTSGSTGKPKGVKISHRNLIANTGSIVSYLDLNRDDRMLVVLPFYYCYGLSLLHTHLRAGGSIVLNNSFIFLGGVIQNLLEFKCTGFAGVPSHFQILLRKSDSFKKTTFPSLKYVTQAGGRLAPVFIDEFRAAHPDVNFIVMYGQTEATARLSWLPPELYAKKRDSIGKGIPGVELSVINKEGKEVNPGETGEVIARGDNIMLGYFKDEEETEKTIIHGWLHTGDVGTIDKDGFIYLTARYKEIIKVRGKRISPKEIETVIMEMPEVIDCTIEGVEDETQGEMIKATVVVKSGYKENMNQERIKNHCARSLSLYKIPSRFVFKEEFMISPTGKKIKKVM